MKERKQVNISLPKDLWYIIKDINKELKLSKTPTKLVRMAVEDKLFKEFRYYIDLHLMPYEQIEEIAKAYPDTETKSMSVEFKLYNKYNWKKLRKINPPKYVEILRYAHDLNVPIEELKEKWESFG